MSGSEISFGWTVLAILLFVGLAVVYGASGRISENLRNAAIWILIFVGVLLAYGARDTITQQLVPSRALETGEGYEVVRAPDGHFYLTLQINGVPVDFVVDTGATQIVLTKADARKVGLDPDTLNYVGFANTANGQVRTAQVVLNLVTLGDLQTSRVRASVNDGEMFESLLGMTYLSQFSEITIKRDRLLLVP
ncbi:MAG: TIGR02281 family clan AA aspartic protease [Pseudomonadota bacterium]